MTISPEALIEKRKRLEKTTRDQMVQMFDDWLAEWLVGMDAQAYPLPYRINWRKCYRAIEDRLPGSVMVSIPGVILDVLDKYKAAGWEISRDDRIEGRWFKKRVNTLVFDKKPKEKT